MKKYLIEPIVSKTDAGKRYYTTGVPSTPEISEISYTVTSVMGDRWDTLAYKYLGSAKYWHILANANNGIDGSIFIKPGTIVTIPEA